MNKKEMMDKIAKMENEIKNLKEKLNKQEEPKRRWKPNLGDIYYFISNAGSIICTHWDDCASDRGRYAIGNVFKTEEEAEFGREQLRILAELEEYADDDKEWDSIINHWCIDYNTEKRCVAAYYLWSRDIPFNIYFSSKEQVQKAIDAIGEERLKKYYFCVEE